MRTTELARAAAANWFATQLRDDWSSSDRQRFEDWLASGDEQRNAWLQMQSTWQTLSDVGAAASVQALRRRAIERKRLHIGHMRSWGMGLAATMVLSLTVLLSYWTTRSSKPSSAEASLQMTLPQFKTAIGEQQTFQLEDGSQVLLNTASEVRVSEWVRSRRLVLERGEAYFIVAKNARKPFIVIVDGASITATGTQFAVRRDPDRVTVILTEGRVRLSDSPNAVDLDAGHEAILTQGARWQIRKSDVAKATSWRTGRLTFDNQPLATVVTELNRYTITQLRLVDAKLLSVPMSGVFRVGDAANFANALQTYGLVRIVSTNDHTIELAAQ